MATLAGAGDEVILPTPWYFNHKMWLDMTGVRTVPLPTGATLVPDPEAAAALIGTRTRAIVLVSPNNPGGAEYPPEVIRAFHDLARDARDRADPRRDLPRFRQPRRAAARPLRAIPTGTAASSISIPSQRPTA